MTRCSFRSDRRPRVRLDHLLLTSALALVLSALPVSMSTEAPAVGWQSALAMGPGGGGPGGGGPGGGVGGGPGGGPNGAGASPGAHGRDIADRARGQHGPAHLGPGDDSPGAGRGYHDVNEFLDQVRNGKAFGLERRDERVGAARDRYQGALGNRGKQAHDLGPLAPGPIAHHFTPEEARALAERGWKGPAMRNDGFKNHGERVRTMVELAKQLGYGAHVGALQANFGTPYENQIAALQDELAEAEAVGDEAEIERLEGELADAIANAKPGMGPNDSWATADLDVNGDGVVDARDLEAIEPTNAAGAGDERPAG